MREKGFFLNREADIREDTSDDDGVEMHSIDISVKQK
jgi:hypothetical protein